MSCVSPLGVIPPQLPRLTDQPPGRSDWIHKIKHYRTMLVLEARLTVRDIRVLVALIADVLGVITLIIGAHAFAATFFIFAAALTLYSLLDWLTLDRQAR